MARARGRGRNAAQSDRGRELSIEEPLPAAEAYQLWAPVYDETVVSRVEQRLVTALGPASRDRTLLDAGCGTGRRLAAAADARFGIGVDLVPAMLRQAAARGRMVAGDLRSLPFAGRRFDLIWCRLVVGHVAALEPVYAELARVATSAAELVISDFHPAAAAAGHRRTFRDRAGAARTVEHHVHAVESHRSAAAAAGWTLGRAAEAPAGEEERPHYERAGRLGQYEREYELPLVLAIRFSR